MNTLTKVDGTKTSSCYVLLLGLGKFKTDLKNKLIPSKSVHKDTESLPGEPKWCLHFDPSDGQTCYPIERRQKTESKKEILACFPPGPLRKTHEGARPVVQLDGRFHPPVTPCQFESTPTHPSRSDLQAHQGQT